MIVSDLLEYMITNFQFQLDYSKQYNCDILILYSHTRIANEFRKSVLKQFNSLSDSDKNLYNKLNDLVHESYSYIKQFNHPYFINNPDNYNWAL